MMISLLDKTRKHDISFHRNGKIDITARVAKALNLSSGDVINVAVDNSECFLYVSHKADECVGNHEAQCSSTKNLSNNLRAYSVRLCRAIMDLVNCSDQQVIHLNCGEKVMKGNKPFLTLIIRNKF